MTQLEQAKSIVQANYNTQFCKNSLSGYAKFTAGLRLCYCIIKYPVVDIIDYSESTPTRIKLEKLKDGNQHFLILIECVYFGSQHSGLRWFNGEIVSVCARKKTGRAPQAGKSQRTKKELRKVQEDFYFYINLIVK